MTPPERTAALAKIRADKGLPPKAAGNMLHPMAAASILQTFHFPTLPK
jgi:hypothetical protein